MDYVTEGVAEYVETLFPKGFKGVCVDVGAYDPKWINNTWLLEKNGWKAYCIEPNPKCIANLKKERKNVLEYACGSSNKDDVDFFVYTVDGAGEAAGSGLIEHHHPDQPYAEFHKKIFTRKEKVKVRTLDWLIENEIKENHIDYLSIDVERNEMEVLRGLTLAKWDIGIIVIEDILQAPEQRLYLEKAGYRYVHRIIYNDFYILNSFYEAMKAWHPHKSS